MSTTTKQIFLVTKKLGMSTHITDDGQAIPVTILKKVDSVVIDHKKEESVGYDSTLVAYELSNKINKPQKGLFEKFKKDMYKHLIELRNEHIDDLSIDHFDKNDIVLLHSKSKGRGFSGTIKRHNFRRGPMGHGSKSHRIPGSIGQCSTPSKVMKGKRMAGQYGNTNIKTKSQIVLVNSEDNILYIKGSCAGANGSFVYVYGNKSLEGS